MDYSYFSRNYTWKKNEREKSFTYVHCLNLFLDTKQLYATLSRVKRMEESKIVLSKDDLQ